MITFLGNEFSHFPNTKNAGEDGLLAIGGNLKLETLLKAYRSGIFPWYNEGDPICWYSPEERCVLFPSEIKISKSMRQVMRSGKFKLTKNQAFDKVIQACASINRKEQDGTWIVSEMMSAYKSLHLNGYAHSIEVWQEEELVGGLYGVDMGHVFCGESMFSYVANASKLALIHLAQNYNYSLIDCQVTNPHLLSMGAREIARKEFLDILGAYKT